MVEQQGGKLFKNIISKQIDKNWFFNSILGETEICISIWNLYFLFFDHF